MMFSTFGDYLLNFSRALDVISEEDYRRTLEVLAQHLRQSMHIEYMNFVEAKHLKDGTVLLSPYTIGGVSVDPFVLKDLATGEYNGQISFSYDSLQPLWIVSAEGDETSLSNAQSFDETWSNVEANALPKYWETSVDGLKTSIIVPSRVLGQQKDSIASDVVINFESPRRLDISERAKKEVRKIVEAVSNLIVLRNSFKRQRESTQQAVSELPLILSAGLVSDILKPKLFVASSNKADDQVIGLIKTVLSEFASQVEWIFWRDIQESGDINAQVISSIATCKFGIAYFSEPSSDGITKFIDNANVLIEAGMMHAHTNRNITDGPTGWIPMREEQSPKTPFDFAAERTLIIPRIDGNELNPEMLKDTLKSRLEELLGD